MADKEFPLSVVIRAVDRITAPLRQINDRMKKITAPVKHVASAIGSVGEETKKLGLKLAALGTAAAYGFYHVFESATAGGDAMAKLAERLKMNVNSLGEYQFAAGRAGIEQDVFNGSLEQFVERVGQAKAGTGKLAGFLERVSPALLRQVRATKSSEQALDLMFRAMGRISDPAKKEAFATAIFGEPKMINMAAQDIKALRAEYRRLAGDQERFTRESGDYNDALGDAQVAFTSVRNAALTELLPTLTDLLGSFKELMVAWRPLVQAWSKDFAAKLPDRLKTLQEEFTHLRENLRPVTDLIKEVVARFGLADTITAVLAVSLGYKLIIAVAELVTALGGLGAALTPVLLGMGRMVALAGLQIIQSVGAFIYAIRAGTGVMYAFNFALWANPIGVVILAITALAAAAYLIVKHWKPIKAFFTDLWDGIVASFDAALERIRAGIAWIVESFNTVMSIGRQVAQRMQFWQAPQQPGVAGPVLGAAGAAPTVAGGMAKPEATVTVNFENLPRGARVTTDPRSSADVNTSLGYAMMLGGM